jgi:carboxylesterase type B
VPRRQPLPIDLEVKAALDQLEPDALQRLTQFARRGAHQLALAGEPIAPDEHEQILHDAITDTMSLVVTWNRHAGMELHLYNVITRRISNGLRRAAKRSRVSLEALATDEIAMASRGSEPEAALGRAQVTQRLYRVARARAAGDPQMLSMLDAYRAEVSDRRAVMAWTGLTLPEVVNARRRLDRLIAGLPGELRRAALAAMRESNIAQVGETTSETND